MASPKYPRTPHLPWSEGATNDDKMLKSVESLLNRELVITEKLDGSGVSLESDGCYARSHSGAPTHASFDLLKSIHAGLKDRIPSDCQVFAEYVFALHSIAYDALPGYLLLFGVRDLLASLWKDWASVEAFALGLGLHTAPVIGRGTFSSESALRKFTEDLARKPSLYGNTREGVVVRAASSFKDEEFASSVAKWVRKGHVDPSSDHWLHKEIVKQKLKETIQ